MSCGDGVSDLLDSLFRCRNGSWHHSNPSSGSSAHNQTFHPSSRTVDYNRYRVISDVYIVTSLCMIGFVGNALTIAVLRREAGRHLNTTNWLLRTLALVDTLYLLACLLIQPLKTITREETWMDWTPCWLVNAYPHWEPYIWPVASIVQTVTIWTVVALTVDRYVAICKPFNTHLRDIRRAQISMICVCVAAVIYNIPVFFERTVELKEAHQSSKHRWPVGLHPVTGYPWNLNMSVLTSSVNPNEEWIGLEGRNEVEKCVPQFETDKSKFGRNKWYNLIYKTICYPVFRSVGPLIILLLLNIKLVQALRITRRRLKVMTSKRQQHRENITVMLIVVVSVFIVCQVPDTCLRIAAERYVPVPTYRPGLPQLINSITNLLITLNSSINFLIYCLVGRKFRRILAQMTPCGARGGPGDGRTEASEGATTAVGLAGALDILDDGDVGKNRRRKSGLLVQEMGSGRNETIVTMLPLTESCRGFRDSRMSSCDPVVVMERVDCGGLNRGVENEAKQREYHQSPNNHQAHYTDSLLDNVDTIDNCAADTTLLSTR